MFEKLGMFHAVTYVMIKDLGVDEFRKKYSPLAEEAVFLPEKANVHIKHWETTLEMSLAVLNVSSIIDKNIWMRKPVIRVEF